MPLIISVLLARLAFISAVRTNWPSDETSAVPQKHIENDIQAQSNETPEILTRLQVHSDGLADEPLTIPWYDIEGEIREELSQIYTVPWEVIEGEIRQQLNETPGMRKRPTSRLPDRRTFPCPRPKAIRGADGSTKYHEEVVWQWGTMYRTMRDYLIDISTGKIVEDDAGKVRVLPPERALFTPGHEHEQARAVVNQLCAACDDDTFKSNSEVLECLFEMRKKFQTYIDARPGMTVRDAAVVLLSFTVSSGALVASALFPPLAGLGAGATFGFKAGTTVASAATTTAIKVGIGGEKLTAHMLADEGFSLIVGVAAKGLSFGLPAHKLGGIIGNIGDHELYSIARTLGFNEWLANSLLGHEESAEDQVAKVMPLVRPLGSLLGILKRRPLHVRSALLQFPDFGKEVQHRALSKTSRNGVWSLFQGLLPTKKPHLHIALLHQYQCDAPATEKDDGYKELADSGHFKEIKLDADLHMTDPSFTLDSPDPSVFGGNIWLAVRLQWRTDLQVPVLANSCAETALPEDLRADGQDPLTINIPLYDEPYDTRCARIEKVEFRSGHRPIAMLKIELQYAPPKLPNECVDGSNMSVEGNIEEASAFFPFGYCNVLMWMLLFAGLD